MKTDNNRAWLLILPVLLCVAFSAILPLMTVVNYSVQDIFNEIEGILRTGLKPEFKPDLPGESETTLADISKAKNLGWMPKTSLKEGLLKSIESLS